MVRCVTTDLAKRYSIDIIKFIMRSFFYLPYLIMFAALGLFAYQNQQATNVSFAIWQWANIPLWWPVTAAAAGFLLIALSRERSWRRR